jgi:hypothetical protein
LTAYIRVQIGLRGQPAAQFEALQLFIEPTKAMWNRAAAGDTAAQSVILSTLIVPKLQVALPDYPWHKAPWGVFRLQPDCLILPFPEGRRAKIRQQTERHSRPRRLGPQPGPSTELRLVEA